MSHNSFAESISASFQGIWSLIMLSLQGRLVYRFNLVVGLFWNFGLALLLRFFWTSLYNGQGTYSDVTLDQTLTYIILANICTSFMPNWLLWEVNRRIRTGDIVFDIMRPMYYGNFLLYQMIGQALAAFVVSFLPVLLAIILFVKLSFPSSWLTWLAFVAALVLGFLIFFFLDLIIALMSFWITEINGINYAKQAVIPVLAGAVIPLWIFPPFVEQILLVLPFRGITYTPLAILVGQIGLIEAPAELGIQLLWVIILAVLSRLVYEAGVQKLSLQGG